MGIIEASCQNCMKNSGMNSAVMTNQYKIINNQVTRGDYFDGSIMFWSLNLGISNENIQI